MSSLPNFDSLWDYNQPAETEKRFRDLLPGVQASGNVSYRVQLLTQIARAQGLQRRFDLAHHTLDMVEGALTPDLKHAQIRYLLERGRVCNSSGNKTKARPLFLEAWEGAIQAGEDFYAIDAAHMRAIIELPEKQMEWNLNAVEIAEKSTDERAHNWLGSLYNNIGWTYHDAGHYEEALATFQKALAYRETQGKEKPIRIARSCIGRTLRSLNRVDDSLAIQRALLQEYEANGDEDGYVYEELSECLLIQEDEEAREWFARSYQILSQDQWLAESEPNRLERLKELGTV